MNKIRNKILHYCWFGNNPLPAETVQYMESWKKFLPDFEIMRWDESNFDVHSVPFTEQAYKEKKWAFVSDYVRCYALYKYGGLYLDTDVEVIRRLDDLFDTSFVGFEHKNVVSPGLILYACEPETKFYRDLLKHYNNLTFDMGNINELTSPIIFTRMLLQMGLKQDNSLQTVEGIKVYPMEYFNPVGDNPADKPHITCNTRTIHWYQASWYGKVDADLLKKRKKYGRFLGTLLFILRHPVAAIQRKAGKNKYNVKI